MTQPYCCPVCFGSGTVPHDFYAHLGAGTTTNREACRSCMGSGIVWDRTVPPLWSPTEPNGPEIRPCQVGAGCHNATPDGPCCMDETRDRTGASKQDEVV